MAEKLIAVSKKQHDAINQLADAIKANQEQLKTIANVILMGQSDEIPQAGVVGARFVAGGPNATDVYYLVLEVPDIAPQIEAPAA